MIIHFIGIGGIGVSALARFYHSKKNIVSGSDLVESEITEALKDLGIKVSLGCDSSNLPKDLDILIYSPAITEDNLERVEAVKRGVKVLSYPEALGELTRKYYTIAVSGTHGKSTTSSMIAKVLIEADFDPSVIIGTKLKELNNSNCRVGESNYLVIEADEYKESFLNYSPSIIVLTNIEKDHLDYYGNLDNILKAFEEYINSINPDGSLIVNRDDENIMKVLGRIDRKDLNIVFYSEKDEDFELIKKTLTLPGKHNVYNGTAVFKLSKILEISEDSVLKSLADFSGSWRRMDIKEISINGKRVTLINDYAHHPTEVRVTLEAMKEKYPDRNVWCVFQPHQYQRTDLLFDNFIKVIQEAVDMNYVNRLSLIDIYDVAGRENLESKARVNSSKLVESVNRKNVEYISKDSILEIISKDIKENDVLILMGAGNIYNLNKKIY